MPSSLLDRHPFSERDDATLLEEMSAVTRDHLARCAEYRRIWPEWRSAPSLDGIPYVHAGVFKHLLLSSGREGRTLVSSGTSGATSRMVMDPDAGAGQAESCRAILRDFIGPAMTPLIIIDRAAALRSRDGVPGRVMAAMSLRPFASEMHFVEREEGGIEWSRVVAALRGREHVRVYSITTTLWTAWRETMPQDVRHSLSSVRIDFVHSGGWKKLEALRVGREDFDLALLEPCAPGSSVLDFYGLVEQNGVIYPLCPAGFRHVPVWAEVLVRDPFTLGTLEGEPGLLQLMNPLPAGAPSHSVLTEDVGRIVPGPCACGRVGRRFELLGRLPKAELRGCANV